MILGEWARRLWYLLNRGGFEAAMQRRDGGPPRRDAGDPRRFGSVLRHREAAADVWGWRWLDDALHDTRFAWRALRRAPGVTLVIVVTLALATGATTAIFSVVNGVVLRPLPFAAPERLVKIHGRAWGEDRGRPIRSTGRWRRPSVEAYRAQLVARCARRLRGAHGAFRRCRAGSNGCPRRRSISGCSRCSASEPLLGRDVQDRRQPRTWR